MFIKRDPDVNSFNDLNEYLVSLEERVFNAFSVLEGDSINLRELAVAPNKPQEGDLINADGASYDPGAGSGLYLFNNGTFEKV